MIFLSFLSFMITFIMGAISYAIGRLFLKLRLTKIFIAKEPAAQRPELSKLEITGGSANPPEEESMAADNKQWDPYAVKFEFTETLSVIGYLLVIIGILTIISALLIFARMADMESKDATLLRGSATLTGIYSTL